MAIYINVEAEHENVHFATKVFSLEVNTPLELEVYTIFCRFGST